MRDQVAEPLSGKPGMQMKGRWLDHKRWWQAFLKVEGDRMVRRRTDRRGDAGELRQRRAVDMAGGHQPRAWIPPQNIAKRCSVAQVLDVHVPDAGDEGRVVQKDQGRPRRR